ncbi:MAG: hypothetical protein ACI977_000629 [Candidatus Nanohaloarchaea archaeon]|jgi:hypothetical protein
MKTWISLSVLLTLLLILSSAGIAKDHGSVYVNHHAHHHGEGVSGGEAYQDWHATFGSNRCRGQSCSGSPDGSVDEIVISDDDGNSATESSGQNYRVWTSDYSWLEGGENVCVYFKDGSLNTNEQCNYMPETNSPPNQPSNPEPAEITDTSPVYNTHPELRFQVSDPDDEPVDIQIYNGYSGTWDFNTCGSSGSSGPSQYQCDNSYSGTTLDNEVNVVNPGIQEWTVPRDGEYRIRAAGASGNYGDGAVMEGTFSLNAGTTLQILVGQRSPDEGGAGGTFVARGGSHTSASPLVVAGGGAGGDGGSTSASAGATHTYGQDSPTGPNGGNNGYGGSGGDGGGGAGFYGNGGGGSDGQGGEAFQNGGEGGSNSASNGGFGGGGTAEDAGADEAGGAGGYSGGGAAEDGGCECAGGGGSFIDSSAVSGATHTGSFTDSSTNDNGYSGAVSDLGGSNSGSGYVTIESEGNLLKSENNVPNGNTYSWEWTNRNIGQTYDWYVQACDDDNECSTSPLWSFDVEQGPLDPYNPEPSDGVVVNSNTVDLNAQYRHQGGSGYDGTLRFYDASNDNEMYSCSVSNQDKCDSPYSWDVDSGETYNWYAVAESNGASETGPTWSFTANTPPNEPSNPSPSDGSTGIDYNSGSLEAYVNDPDDHDMSVTFNAQSSSDTFSKTTDVSGSGTASVSYSNLEPGEIYEWTVTAEDEYGASTSSDTWEFTTNYKPTIANPDPVDGDFVNDDSVEVSVDVSDNDGDETDVQIYDEDGNEIASETTPDGSSVVVEGDYSGLVYGEDYTWTVEASDAYGQTSRNYNFGVIGSSSFRSSSGIDYEYSSIVKSSDQSRYFEYTVTNENVDDKELETRLEGAEAEFQSHSGSSHTYTLDSGETEEFTIEVTESQVGKHTLDVITEDRRLGAENVDSLPILVREYDATNIQEVPGLMWMQVLSLAAAATVLYSALL